MRIFLVVLVAISCLACGLATFFLGSKVFAHFENENQGAFFSVSTILVSQVVVILFHLAILFMIVNR